MHFKNNDVRDGFIGAGLLIVLAIVLFVLG
jgi:hypothetical protein